MTRPKGIIANLCLLAAGCAVAVAALEGCVRLAHPHTRDYVLPGRLFAGDDTLGWVIKPDRHARHRTRYFDVDYQTNGTGFRDAERDPAPNPDIHRILLYGDSQVFGWGVPMAERFSNILEAGTPRLEVWNLAVPAYGLDQEVLLYESAGSAAAANEVMFLVSDATLRRLYQRDLHGRTKPVFELSTEGRLRSTRPAPTVGRELAYEVLGSLYLPYFVNARLASWRAKAAEPLAKSAPAPSAPSRRVIGDLEEAVLARARAVAARRGQAMTIVTDLPESTRVELRELCERHEIGFVPIVLDDFSEPLMHGPHDPHWTPAVHREIARQLSQHVRRPARPVPP